MNTYVFAIALDKLSSNFWLSLNRHQVFKSSGSTQVKSMWWFVLSTQIVSLISIDRWKVCWHPRILKLRWLVLRTHSRLLWMLFGEVLISAQTLQWSIIPLQCFLRPFLRNKHDLLALELWRNRLLRENLVLRVLVFEDLMAFEGKVIFVQISSQSRFISRSKDFWIGDFRDENLFLGSLHYCEWVY